ncbi:MAG: dimethylsulfoniopropionate demethylase [Pseudomonadota bacterium]
MALQEDFRGQEWTAQSASPLLAQSRRTRSTPFSERVRAAGAQAFTVYNHMLLPSVFNSLEDDYWHLVENVQLWDVSAQRQIELAGPDAMRLAQLMTPRDITTKFDIGQCKYAPLIDQHGGILNDPVIIRVAEDRLWLSIADSDVLLWAKGLALGFGLDVEVTEPDVFPLAVQGPLADDLMADVFGAQVREIRFFRSELLQFNGVDLRVARSGWSKQGGFEIYLDVPALAHELWDTLWSAGQSYNVRAGGPNLIERIESGLLSFGNDMTRMNTPLECGLDKYCALDKPIEFIGKEALLKQREQGVPRKLFGLVMDGAPIAPATVPWTVFQGDAPVGYVTSAVYSPRFQQNIAFAMLTLEQVSFDDIVEIEDERGSVLHGRIYDLPFDPAMMDYQLTA